ncbi:hypothetical protein U27_05588 [Candidatus Vecturithrix granuli]|uniref:Uncharacterized protein n=1 Tax=Vecturithrix granuli TaxID=1499967 RepID=A0A081C209_VECG1|nr:hypothetical protein U27_05588 [Candidatus Vecturithrix granuli]
MSVKPVLGGWEIPRIESIKILENRSFVELTVPGRVGSLFQDMNTAPTCIVISGSLYGDEARNAFLEEVRGKFRDGEPVTFVADIVTATEIQYVIIGTLHFEESGTKPDQIGYFIVLKESPPPSPPADPLGGLDAGLLDQADNFLDSVTGALDIIDLLGNVPNIDDPTPPLRDALEGISSALDRLKGITGSLNELFGGRE